jgi:hypothetical protein
MLSIKNASMLMTSVSGNVLVESECVFLFLQNKICPFLAQSICIYVRSFNFTFHYIDDFFSLNKSRFGDFVDSIYPIELAIKDTTNADRSASYLDLHL